MAWYFFNSKFTLTWEGWRDCDETLLLTQRGSSSPSNTKVQLLQKQFFIITSNLAHLFYVLLKLNHLLPEIRLLHFPCFEPDICVVHCEPKNILMSICDLDNHPQINLLVLFWIPSTKPVIIAPTPWLTSKAADSFTSWYICYYMSTKIGWRLWTWLMIWTWTIDWWLGDLK